MKFEFIRAEKAKFTIVALCRCLGVSTGGYHAFEKREECERRVSDRALAAEIEKIHAESRGTYGAPRVHAELKRRGHEVGEKRVARIMRLLGLKGCAPRRFRTTTIRNPKDDVAPNTLARNFTATRPNERWVTDITYVWTSEGWSYLAVILDLFSRSVVGWSLATDMSTDLPLAALRMALGRRLPNRNLLHHSDRGCQYTSAEYRRALADHGIAASMSRKGNCWDNAVAESFFSTIKTELISLRNWSSSDELRAEVFDYIELFYNRKRLHSSLGYQTPIEVERAYDSIAA